jgi:hypothetical protein
MDPYKTAIEDRIRELLHYRRWLRNDYPFLRAHLEPEYNAELHVLLRLARKVRKSYGTTDWTEAERRVAAGDR